MAHYVLRRVFILMFLTLPALARNNGQYAQNSELGRWFESLENAQKGNCCSVADGLRIDAPDWRPTLDPEFPDEVSINGKWIKVPKAALVRATNRVGYAIVWPVTGEMGNIWIRCFLPGVEL
jgi:hypothetical protein